MLGSLSTIIINIYNNYQIKDKNNTSKFLRLYLVILGWRTVSPVLKIQTIRPYLLSTFFVIVSRLSCSPGFVVLDINFLSLAESSFLGFSTNRPVSSSNRPPLDATMLALGPKKDGSPNVKFFESPETLNMLEGVRTWLMKNHKKVRTLLFMLMFRCIHDSWCRLLNCAF